jgi:hypothetical protein
MTNPLRQRVLQMALVWAFLGQWVGADIGMRAGGLAGSIAGSVAVMVEMAVLGAFLGWIGGRPRDTIVGGALGVVAGVMLAPLSVHTDLLSRANIGLIAGASDGAMLRPYLRMIGRVLGMATRRLGSTFLGTPSPGLSDPSRLCHRWTTRSSASGVRPFMVRFGWGRMRSD